LKLVLLTLIVSFGLSGCRSFSIRNRMKTDKFSWLEERESKRSLRWVHAQRRLLEEKIGARPGFERTLKSATEVLGNGPEIGKIEAHGNFLYTLHQEAPKSRGIWKRTPIGAKYRDVSRWEDVLNLDWLSKKENKNYSLQAVSCLKPSEVRCLLSLAEAGSEESVTREFNTNTKRFVRNGFSIPNSRNFTAWVDANTIVASATLGPQSKTDTGYGNTLKKMRRGEEYSGAKPLLTVPSDYLTIFPEHLKSANQSFVIARRYKSVLEIEPWLITAKTSVRVRIPSGSIIQGVINDRVVVSLKSAWDVGRERYRPGDVVDIAFSKILQGKALEAPDISLLFRPSKNQFTSNKVAVTKSFVAIEVVENVKGKIVVFENKKGDFRKVSDLNRPNSHTKLIGSSSSNDRIFVKEESFLSPERLSDFNLVTRKLNLISAQKPAFDPKNMYTIQRWAQSKDGTKIPYFLTGKKASLKSGKAPTILRGYGGYGISQLPNYRPIFGKAWLERGGLFAVANVRGGGEFGSKWHAAAVRETKQTSIDDFIAVSEDLLKTHITIPQKLGIYGGSLGGVVIGGAYTQRPELFGAASVVVPVLDVLAGTRLNTGNWYGELGNPKKQSDFDFIAKFSPYENVKKGVKYPPFFAYSTLNDGRVHPAHARKMVAKLQSYGNPNSFYIELNEGGHWGTSDKTKEAFWTSLMFEFFDKNLGL